MIHRGRTSFSWESVAWTLRRNPRKVKDWMVAVNPASLIGSDEIEPGLVRLLRTEVYEIFELSAERLCRLLALERLEYWGHF
jgi:hypothetical protein